jgi:hypothetical protein
MPRSIRDHNIPFILTRSLPGHDITHASQLGWQEMSNGKLLAAAEKAGFDIRLPCQGLNRHPGSSDIG